MMFACGIHEWLAETECPACKLEIIIEPVKPKEKNMPNIDGTPHGTHDFEDDKRTVFEQSTKTAKAIGDAIASIDDEDDENDAFDGRVSPLQRDIEKLAKFPTASIKDAKTEIVDPGLDEIPYEGLAAVGRIFHEGLKYGRDNWKKGVGNVEYQRERTRHAIRHLMLWANGDRSEAHLAKVAWFCLTQIWIEKNEK